MKRSESERKYFISNTWAQKGVWSEICRVVVIINVHHDRVTHENTSGAFLGYLRALNPNLKSEIKFGELLSR